MTEVDTASRFNAGEPSWSKHWQKRPSGQKLPNPRRNEAHRGTRLRPRRL